jgi:hypothetical protein
VTAPLTRVPDDAAGTGAPDAGRQAPGLRRFLGPRPPAVERCELCSVALDARHRHLVDVRQRVLACACTACALLFDRDAAAGGRFRPVPDRYLADPGWRPEPGAWEALGVPVGVAFFLRNSAQDRTVALYPSPAGATESEVDARAWEAFFAGSVLAGELAPDTEALIVRHTEVGTSCHLVPVDAAYELVGRLRLHWSGFDGGERARAEVDGFFAELARRATPREGLR